MTSRRAPNFGTKQVFLPNFTLTLLRTPFLPPTFATFIVPLNLTKIDVRDYVYHAYGINVLSVRSFVQQQKVRRDRPGARIPAPPRWFRPRAIKKMTIEMDKPFVWPEEPDDFAAWDKDTYDATHKQRQGPPGENTRTARNPGKPPDEREGIAEQARLLLTGQERWRPQWEDEGEPVEVEKHLPMS